MPMHTHIRLADRICSPFVSVSLHDRLEGVAWGGGPREVGGRVGGKGNLHEFCIMDRNSSPDIFGCVDTRGDRPRQLMQWVAVFIETATSTGLFASVLQSLMRHVCLMPLRTSKHFIGCIANELC